MVLYYSLECGYCTVLVRARATELVRRPAVAPAFMELLVQFWEKCFIIPFPVIVWNMAVVTADVS